MSRAAVGLFCLMLLASLALAAPKDLTVYGRPAVGAFGVNSLEQVEGAAKLNMTLIFSYSAAAARKQLDLNDPVGQAVRAHRMKVMYPVAHTFTRVRLARTIRPTDTTLPVTGEEPSSALAFPEQGCLMIEGERIEYTARTAAGFSGCTRGAGGTKAARHPAGLLLCNSEGLHQEVLLVKDSPSLWGYWLVDDNRPQELDSLREMSRIIRATDADPRGGPTSHVIVIGIGDLSAMANFDVGIGDALGVYPYPYRKGVLNMTTRNQLRFIMTRARSLQPDIGLLGIYQAFASKGNENWNDMPTPEQVREDMLSFYEWGADGLLAFMYHWQGENGEPQGLDAFPEVAAVIARTNAEVLAGKVKRVVPPVPPMEWFAVLTGDEALPTPGGTVLYDLENPEKLAALVKGRPNRFSPEPFTVAGRSYPLRADFPAWDNNDPESDRWPGGQFAAEALATTDWSQARYLEQPIYNPGEDYILLRLSIEDTAKGWWERSGVEIPPQTPVLLRVPLAEARLSIDPARIRRWLLWEADPTTAVSFRLGSPLLVP